MASIDRTAYPRLKRRPSAQELADVYTPNPEELAFLRATARGPAPTLTVAVLLKGFMRLGYFPRLQEVPFAVVAHLRSCLRLPQDTALDVTPRTLYKHQQAIRAYLRVAAWGPEARHAAVTAVHQAAQVMDHPADLINVAIEELVRQRFELPAFSTLDHVVQRVRALAHRRHFGAVMARLTEANRQRLDALLESEPPRPSIFNALKQAARRPSLSHLAELGGHLRWLESLGDQTPVLAALPPAKIRHFAAEARALDAAELKRVVAPKRYTLLLCLIARAQVQARDDLAETFCKRMARIHVRGQEELERLRIQYRETMEALLTAVSDVLHVLEPDPPDAEAGRQVKQVVRAHGEVPELLATCDALAAYSGDNYLPLLWRFYRSHRPTLFRLARTLRFVATSQDSAVLDALRVLLTNEDRTGDWLPVSVDLSFTSEQWRRTILVDTIKGVQIARRPFEVCVFSYLASELKSGDLAIDGSDAYADYREQLLPWVGCEPQVAEYCQELGFPPTAAGFVEQLRTWLTDTAERVDAGYPSNGQVTITAEATPVQWTPVEWGLTIPGRSPRAEESPGLAARVSGRSRTAGPRGRAQPGRAVAGPGLLGPSDPDPGQAGRAG